MNEFVIGMDLAKDKNNASYCLAIKLKSGNQEIIMEKGFFLNGKKSRNKFKKEVKRLAKYFGATIVKEKN